MIRPMTAALIAMGVLASTPAWACLPPPPNASYDTAMARAVFVARVLEVERTDPAQCLAAAQARAASGAVMQGDPGARGCEAFGFATLEPVRVIKGEEITTSPVRVAWNSVPFCAVGWTAEVGELAIVMVPDAERSLPEGATATVEGIHQHEPLFRTILDLVAETRP
jgi:hypothetical protein